MSARVFVVTATEVLEGPTGSGEISFMFMFDVGVFPEIQRAGLPKAPYGLIERVENTAPQTGGSLWKIWLGKNGEQVLSGAGDPSDDGDVGMLLRNIPDCILLMQRDMFDQFEKVCKGFGHEVIVHHHEGTLHKS